MKQQGFSLIELIIVIVLTGILASVTTDIIRLPVQSYLDLARRARLLDNAEMSIKHLQNDIRHALPNSIRISGASIEMVNTLDAGRYRAFIDTTEPAPTALCAGGLADDTLIFDSNDTCFQTIGHLQAFNPQSVNGEFLVIYNLNPSDVYSGSNRSALNNASQVGTIEFNSKQFPYRGAGHRFFIVDQAITYTCIANELRRYQGYDFNLNQVTVPSLDYDLQAKSVSNCEFIYNPDINSGRGLVTIRLALADETGEGMTVVHQVHINNIP